MKLSCTPISCSSMFANGPMDTERFVAFCAEQEIEGIDLLHTQYKWFWKDKERELKQVRSWIDRAGLTLTAYGCSNNFAKSEPAEFEQNVAIVIHALQEAQSVGAPILRIFGGRHSDIGKNTDSAIMDYAAGFQRILQGIARCLPAAEKSGVILALENHGRLPGHSYEVERILRHFDSPWLRCCFDCANFVAGNMDEMEDPLRAYERLAPYVAHVHVKDFTYQVTERRRQAESCVLGQGLVPIRQFAAMLEENRYPGYCSLEYEADRVTPAAQGVPASFAYLRSVAAIHRVLPPGSIPRKETL